MIWTREFGFALDKVKLLKQHTTLKKFCQPSGEIPVSATETSV